MSNSTPVLAPSPVVAAGNVRFANDAPIALIAGPCQMESRAHTLEMAEALRGISQRLGIGLVFKASYDKANRTSLSGARGIGMAGAMAVFAEIKQRFGLPVLTDVHEPGHCAPAAEDVDILQTPPFLRRRPALL